MKLHRLLGFWVSTFLSLTVISGISARQSSPVPQTNQTEKRDSGHKKVWTNDEVAGLRAPSDTYLNQKLAAEEKAAEAEKTTPKAKDDNTTKQVKPSRIDVVAPKTLEEGEKRIAEKNDLINKLQPLIEEARVEYSQAPDDAGRIKVQEKIELLRGQINRADTEAKLLQIKLDELKSNPQQVSK